MGRRRRVTLPKSMCPRPFQQDWLADALDMVSTEPEAWHLYQCPTGTGKSIMALMYLAIKPDTILTTPRVEILAGVLDKMGHFVEDMSQDKIVKTAELYGMFTPGRLRNVLAKGELPFEPDGLVVDEAHHDLADTYQDITMYLNGVPKVGLTATAYRGTPKGTAAFHEQWGNRVNLVLTQKEAIDQGYCSFPTAVVWPLVDDDIIEVQAGEIKASAADAVITDRIDALVDRVKPFWCKRSRMWDRSTMFAVPTTNLVNQLHARLEVLGMASAKVTQATSRRDRNTAFSAVKDATRALVQIDVVSEGVDLPIRRLIDCRPTLSPVRWVQQLGRIMRRVADGELPPEYICCCRNLERHCYLMEGVFPTSTIVEAQEAFPRVSKRAGMRAIGMESLGQFTTTPMQSMSGITYTTYNVVRVEQFERTEFLALLHPNELEPTLAERRIRRLADGSYDWRSSRWRLIDQLPNLTGFASAKPRKLTDKQRMRWNEWAQKLGLNPHKEPTERGVELMFFLKDTRLVLK